MKRFVKLFVVFAVVVFLAGCATLKDMAQEAPQTDPTAEIAAVSTLTGDLVASPWDNILQVGLGYGLALLRRWYKKKKGAE
jgi:flagellar basal body-associated protein FliL